MQKDFYRFRARYILLDIIVSLIFVIFIGILLLAVGIKIEPEDPLLNYSLGSLFILLLCFIIFLRLKGNGIKVKYLIGDMTLQRLSWLELLIVFYGVYSLSTGISQLTTFFINVISPSFAKSAIESLKLQYPFIYETDSLFLKALFFITLFIYIVIIAPLTEEFIFRGVLLHRLSTKWGAISGIILSSLLFGALHMNIHAISLAISGALWSLMYIKTKTLTVPILLHMINNSIAMFAIFINIISPSNRQVEITLQTLWSGLFYTAFALPILLYFLKYHVRLELLPYTANIERGNINRLESN